MLKVMDMVRARPCPARNRADIGKGIAEQVPAVSVQLSIVSSTILALYQSPFFIGSWLPAFAVEIAQLALDLDVAEFVALAFLDHIGDDEVALVGRQFGHGGNHAEIGIALGQVELAQLLLVKAMRSGS
jgi:hypothetical protein